MNTLYRIIWYKAKQPFVAVSEFTKLQKKGTKGVNGNHTTTIRFVRQLTTALISAIMLSISGQVLAADVHKVATISQNVIAKEESSIAIGYQAAANAKNTLAIGNGARADLANSVAIGSNSTANTLHTTKDGGNYTYNGINDDKVAGVTDVVGVFSVGKAEETRQVQQVAAGVVSKDSTDAINGSQLHYTYEAIHTNAASISINASNISDNSDDIALNKANIEINKTNIANNTAKINAGLNFTGDNDETYNYQLGNTIDISGDENVTTVATADGVQVTLNKNITVDRVAANTLTTGNTVITNDGMTIGGNNDKSVSVTSSGLNNGGNRITHVAPGIADTDAVNVFQLNALDNKLTKHINHVADDANAGTASAIAATNLPQPHHSGKSMVSVGLGHYQGESAIAIGASTISDNGKWIMKGSVSIDTQSNTGVGVGVGYQW